MKIGMILIGLMVPAVSFSHAVFEQKEVETDSYYKAIIGIGHGCEGSSIKQVIVELPVGVHRAKPMPKAGWKVETVISKLETPYQSYGQEITQDVKKIIWSGGPLLDTHFDEFIFKAKIDAEPQTLYFPTKQICETGEIYWADIPEKGKTTHDYKSPAPALKVLHKTSSGHHH
jgi:uncharacterized protein YcnI